VFRFTIRDLLWLMVVVAVAMAWWVNHRRQAAEIHELKHPQPGFDISEIEAFQNPRAAEPDNPGLPPSSIPENRR
jgi:hypothetical protein